jgi:hypothetical protein
VTFGTAVLIIVIIVLVTVVGGIPAYVIGSRRRVTVPEVAFVPFLGPSIVMLQSMEMSGWIVLLMCVPIVGFFVSIWFVFAMPNRHGRTRAWGILLLVPLVNVIAYWVYAFTLSGDGRSAERGLSGYHVAPQAVGRRRR